jgi:DNA mismatch repair protein MutL
MPEIRVLPRHLINKIAAGEVIERPASVVKELVENALDAGAGRIVITVEEGGARLIAVSDDGRGMSPEDLALAFVPHATSKIASEEDLLGIRTMGFRGEALSSIASVSHACILTRRAGDDSGWEIRADGESVSDVRPAPAPPGSSVSVRDLFFNTPARRKFMRAAATEFGYITEQLIRHALPNSQVAFTLTHNGRVVQQLEPAGLLQRAQTLLGPEVAGELIEFDSPERSLRLRGLLGRPSAGRANANWQYFFVNGRFVRDRFLSHALREAYRGLIDPGRYPVAVVFLDLPPEEVDVNVHPAKIEVRFRNSQQVHSAVLAVSRETLQKADLSPAVQLDPASGGGLDDPAALDHRRSSLKQALADFFKSAPRPQPRLDYPPGLPPGMGSYHGRRHDSALPIPIPDRPGEFTLPAAALPAAQSPVDSPAGAPASTAAPQDVVIPPQPIAQETAIADWAGQAALGSLPYLQVHNTYLVVPTADGLDIIDQHALHERILYEELSRRVSAGNLPAQRLLIPEVLEAGPTEKALLAEHANLLDRLGLEVGSFGPSSLAIQKYPLLLAQRGVAAKSFLRDLLDLLAQGPQGGEEALSAVLETMACKAAVKAGDPLTPEEISALLARRQQIDRSSACPHGRPTTLSLSLGQLQKQFKRT